MIRPDKARSDATASSVRANNVLLIALLVVALAQVARVLFPIMFEIGEDWDFLLAGLVALLTFATPMVALAARRLDPDAAVIAGAAVVGGALLGLRLVDPIPAWLAVGAVAAALIGGTLFVARFRFGELVRSGLMVPAVVLGLAGDVVVRAGFGSWDLVWQSGAVSLAVSALIAAGLIGLAARSTRLPYGDATGELAPRFWVGLGAYLVLQLMFLQNFAFVGSQGGLGYSAAVAVVLTGGVVGVAAAAAGEFVERSGWLAVAVVATLATWSVSVVDGVLVGVVVIVMQAAVTALLAGAATLTAEGTYRGRVLWATAGSVLFLAVVLLWSLHIDQPLPFPRQVVPALAALMIGLLALRRSEARAPADWFEVVPTAGIIALLAVVAPVALAITSPEADIGGADDQLRLVNYNVRGSVGTDGQLAPDRIVAEIRSSDPDVVILQEVARGWPIHGTMDLAAYLARELGMNALYVAAADGQFGNAILSRLPMQEIDQGFLPEDGSQRRAYLIARIATSGEEAVISAAHIHSRSVPQIEALLAAGAVDSRHVVAGDFNFAPDDPELSLFTAVGLVDVIGATGDACRTTSAEPTSSCDRPDWVFVTPDWVISDVRIGDGGSSDHLAIHVTLDL